MLLRGESRRTVELEDEFGDVIAKARAGRGLFAAQTARTAGLTESQLQEIEQYRMTPGGETVKQLAETLHLNPEKLIETASATWSPVQSDPSSESLLIRRVHVPFGQYGANAYIAACTRTLSAAVIDPGGAVDEIKRVLQEQDLTLELVLITHSHADHTAGLSDLLRGTSGVTVACSPDNRETVMTGVDAGWSAAEDGAEFSLGQVTVTALATPGHTQGSTCYVVNGACFVGDTLFAGSIGRPSSSIAYGHMLADIRSKVLSLPHDTVLLPGHGPITTVAEELEHNPFF